MSLPKQMQLDAGLLPKYGAADTERSSMTQSFPNGDNLPDV